MEMIVYRNGVPHTCYYDAEDAEKVTAYKWHIVTNKAETTLYLRSTKISGAISMHRLVMGFPENDIDHQDSNGLNNQKDNLRPATHQKNCFNRRKRTGQYTSPYKGVCFRAKTERWLTQLNGKHVGSFATELEAAQAYNVAALAAHGEFALLNTIGGA
jgi:hypothetical protein